ncbi:hypothetical protein MSI_02120 [Treponema sp. JC4]|uniref:hypothetical protein n=1 Tax=Treponema sp. JC4 TaxID=1124982 RepID=UPI00025B0D4E|nr:hypothetical protein [Treponema sp. JC4]EID86256.1 hypothetical protein MSI_02120 [Treponema sp. JC4]
MKNTFYRFKDKIETVVALIAVLGFLSGCSNIISNSRSDEDTKKECIISGKISVGSSSGAISSQVLNVFSENCSSARSATSSFDTSTIDISFGSLYVTLNGSVDGKTKSFNANITKTESGWAYLAAIPSSGEWMLVGGMSTPDTGWILYGSSSVTVDEKLSPISDADFFVSPRPVDGVAGKINLQINNETETVTSVFYEWAEEIDGLANGSLTFADGVATFAFDEVPAGSHEVTLIFKDSSNNELYSCKEVITVFSGFITDSWYGESPYFQYDEVSNSYRFILTDSIIESYESTPAGALALVEDTAVTSTPYVLWSSTTDEFSSDARSCLTADSVTTGGTTTMAGLQVFGEVNESTTITRPISAESNPVFCFGDGYLWILSGSTVTGYKQSYSGYVKDYDNVIDLESLVKTDTITSPYLGDVLAYYDGSLYFIWYYYSSGYKYNLSRYILSSGNVVTVSIDDSWNKLYVNSYNNTPLAVYAVTSSSGTTIYKCPLTITDTSITLGTAESYEVAAEKFGFSSLTSINVGDFLVSSSKLYVLLYSHSSYSGVYDLYINSGTEGEPSYTREKYFCASNGGILQFDLSATEFIPTVWSDGSTKVLGWYTDSESSSYYIHTYISGEGNVYKAVGDNLTIQPPLEEAGNWFYGAKKFIAIKPDELVIADEGAYIDKTDGNYNIHSKNRVVTVNLASESISATDVNVTFSTKFGGCGSIGMSD